DYVHRIGRTGRAGTKGEAISLVSVDENGFLREIERLTKNEIPKEIIDGFAPPAHERPEPIVLGRMVIGEGAARGGMRRSSGGPRGDSRGGHGGGGNHRGGGGHGGSISGNAGNGNPGGHNGSPAGGAHRQSPPRPQGPARDGRSGGGGSGRPPARLITPKR
ncbi:MAG: RNA helicase, partial [Caldimonas sp.]